MGTVLLVLGIAALAVLVYEFGQYRRAKKHGEEGMFDHSLPFVADGNLANEDRIGDEGAMDHIDPSDHPGV